MKSLYFIMFLLQNVTVGSIIIPLIIEQNKSLNFITQMFSWHFALLYHYIYKMVPLFVC